MTRPFPPATAARPVDGGLVLSVPWVSRAVELSREAALALFDPDPDALRGAVADAVDDPGPADPSAADPWMRRGWGLSLGTYLASRVGTYADQGDDWRDRQRDIVRRYLEGGPAPEVPRPTADAEALPPAGPVPPVPLSSLLPARRSVQRTRGRPLSAALVGGWLWHTCTHARGKRRFDLDADPADAMRSYGITFDVYLLAYAVEGVAPGAYRYELDEHALSPIVRGDLRPVMQSVQQGQAVARTASAALLLVADFERAQWRYRHERGLRHVYLEAGRLIQRALWIATAHGLDTHLSPAVRDREALRLLGLPLDRHQVVHTASVG